MNKQHLRWFLTLKATEEGNEKGRGEEGKEKGQGNKSLLKAHGHFAKCKGWRKQQALQKAAEKKTLYRFS